MIVKLLSIAPWIALVLCVACTSPAPPPAIAEEGPHSLTVELTDLSCCDQTVRIALYRDKATWLRTDSMFKARFVIPNGRNARISLYGLPAGVYAVAAFQDLNDNGKLDQWLGVLPREPVGFSNRARVRGRPSFERSRFVVPDTTVVRLSMAAD